MSSAIIYSILFAIILIAVIGILVGGYFIARMRSIYHREAAFICAYSPDLASGWTEGYAEMSKNALQWYRAFAIGKKPAKSWAREHLEIMEFQRYPGKNGAVSLRVLVQCDGHRFYLFMAEECHSALVAWLEAAPPRPPQATDWGFYAERG